MSNQALNINLNRHKNDRVATTFLTGKENSVKFGLAIFEIYERTDRQTDIQTCWSQYFWGEVTKTFT